MKNFKLWYYWLLAVTVVTIVFGLLLAFFNHTSIFDLYHEQIEAVFFKNNVVPQFLTSYKRFVLGVMGIILASWAIQMLFTLLFAFRKKERWSWIALSCNLLIWYCLDSGLSLYLRVLFNVAFNTAVLLLFMIPLAFTMGEVMTKKRSSSKK